MRYWLTYFWTLCFTPSPHNLPFLHSDPFLQPSFPVPFIFFFVSLGPLWSLVLSELEVRSEATWLVYVAECEQPGNKGLCCWRSVAQCQTFTFTPLLPSSLSEENPCRDASMGIGGEVGCEAAKFGCCHEESHTGSSSARERWENKRRWRTSAKGPTRQPLSEDEKPSFGCQGVFSKNVWLEETDFQSTNKKKKNA